MNFPLKCPLRLGLCVPDTPEDRFYFSSVFDGFVAFRGSQGSPVQSLAVIFYMLGLESIPLD